MFILIIPLFTHYGADFLGQKPSIIQDYAGFVAIKEIDPKRMREFFG